MKQPTPHLKIWQQPSLKMIARVCSGRFLEAKILKVGERGTKLTEGKTLAHPVCVRLMFNLLVQKGKKRKEGRKE